MTVSGYLGDVSWSITLFCIYTLPSLSRSRSAIGTRRPHWLLGRSRDLSAAMVSFFEGAIYLAAVILSTLAGAGTLVGLSHVPALALADRLGDLSRSTWWIYAFAVGGTALVGLILYRWPYMERTITFRQLKGRSRFACGDHQLWVYKCVRTLSLTTT